jgi:murein L,D-transpeptidase YafK
MGKKLRIALLTGVVGAAALASAGRARPSVKLSPCTQPRIVVHKHEAQLELVCKEGSHRYPVTFGADPVGPKQRRGDERTPEGRYSVSAKVENARFHRFMKLSYPNAEDVRRARAAGVDPGGGVGIHGVRASLAGLARLFIRSGGALSSRVWGPTDGCIGMVNEDVEVVYDSVPVGTEVRIEP